MSMSFGNDPSKCNANYSNFEKSAEEIANEC